MKHIILALLLIGLNAQANEHTLFTPYLGIYTGYNHLATDNVEADKNGYNFGVKLIGSFDLDSTFLDIAGGWQYNKMSGETGNNVKTKITTKSPFLEADLRFKLSNTWSLGPAVGVHFGTDNSYNEVDGESEAVTLGGLRAMYQTSLSEKYPVRLELSALTNISERSDYANYIMNVGLQFGWPMKKEKKQEAIVDSDTDKDGIPNLYDRCPTKYGVVENEGCPLVNQDSDRDGVLNSEDACPTVAGVKENDGCPMDNDMDKDGISNSVDACPTVKGIIENKGCPESEVADVKVTLKFAKVKFATGKADLDEYSEQKLTQLGIFLAKRPQMWQRVKVSGHTDSRGSKELNDRLSLDRADSVLKVFVKAGVDESKIYARGYGFSKPIDTRKNEVAYEKNRRTEIEFFGVGDRKKFNEMLEKILKD